VGLLVYADGAYTVAPLTDDAANVAIFLDALAPDIMPGEPGDADAAEAIDRSASLLRQAGYARGDILLVSGSPLASPAAASVKRAAAEGYRVSVLDAATLAADDADLAALGLLQASPGGALARGREGVPARRDDGYWLLLPLLLLAAFAFRRNGAMVVLAACLLLPWRPAAAAGVDWWQRADQRAHRQLQRGAEAYRAGRYEEAARAWRGVPGPDAAYDRGNALARLGQYERAIAAYDEALRERPGMADALANRKAVEAAMKRRPPPGQGDRQASGKPGDRPQPQDDAGASNEAKADEERAKAAQEAARQREAARRARAGDRGRPQDGRQMQESQAQHERRLANQARLQRVPDDPGGLLRERLRIEYERRRGEGE
jgi:Ca-activated chloride channel family protein